MRMSTRSLAPAAIADSWSPEMTTIDQPCSRVAPATILAAVWAWVSVRRARRLLKSDGVTARIPPPPKLPVGATRGVLGVLWRLSPTCLERATVMQTWLAAHGEPFEIVVGVASDAGGMRAHAWLEQPGSSMGSADYREIYRISAPHWT